MNLPIIWRVSRGHETRRFLENPCSDYRRIINQCASYIVLTVVGAQSPRSRVAPRAPPSVRHRPEAVPVENARLRARVSCALCAATPRPVNIMACVPARAARASSRGPCRKAPNTCVWPTKLARWTSAGEIAASSAGFRSAWWSAWSRR